MFGRKKNRGAKPAAIKNIKPTPAKAKPAKKPEAAPTEAPQQENQSGQSQKKELPDKFPFWARLKFEKWRTTLVIDEDSAWDKEHKRYVDGYVHREATHTKKSDFEEIKPNPDKDDPEPMYLKRPRKHPKRLFAPHNKDLSMPEHLKERYDKNNHKNDTQDNDKKEQ